MIVRGREIPAEIVEMLRQNGAVWSLRRAARELCSRLEWIGPGGKAQVCLGMQVVRQLEKEGWLPAQVRSNLNIRRTDPRPPVAPDQGLPANAEAIVGSLDAVEPVELVRVNSRFSRHYRIWRELLDRYHYLRSGPLCGPQLRYLIGSPRGWLGAMAVSAAARRVHSREQWIGWSEEARRENLPRIVSNSRFLILPHVQVPHLASHVLAKMTRQLAADWQERHGYRPVLIETFVETQRFRGICYCAANWQGIGISAGRGRQDSEHRCDLPPKSLWVFPLSKHFKKQLCQVPEKRRLAPVVLKPAPVRVPPSSQEWMDEEFGQCELGDQRLESRLRQIAADFFARPGMNIPQACGHRAKTKAVYRFLDHPRVNLHSVLQGHFVATQRRAAAHPVILVVQDTTELNYSAHPATEWLGPLCDKKGVIGLLLHETMAYNVEGTALGLIDAQCWTRDAELENKREQRYELKIEQKESSKWLVSLRAAARLQEQCPNSLVISVGDREADLHELFVEAARGGPNILVRAHQNRVVKSPSEEGGTQGIWEYVGRLPPAGKLMLNVPRRKGQKPRTAELSIRFTAVELQAPKRKPELGPVSLWAIAAREEQPPEGTEAIEWLLLTSLPVKSFAEAIEKLRWYALRFQIEIYHRTLKSGCKIEERQLGNAQRLESCLAIDLVVAWRIVHLTKLGREVPQLPCTVFFEDVQWKALVAYVTKNPVPPAQPPLLGEAIRMMAMHLGGFLGRKSDGEPGTETIWRGLQRLDDVTEMYGVMQGQHWTPPTCRELLDTS